MAAPLEPARYAARTMRVLLSAACIQYDASMVRKPGRKGDPDQPLDREGDRRGNRIADLRGFLRGSNALELRRAERQPELDHDSSRAVRRRPAPR